MGDIVVVVLVVCCLLLFVYCLRLFACLVFCGGRVWEGNEGIVVVVVYYGDGDNIDVLCRC